MFNIYEWNSRTHQEFKQNLNGAKEMGVKFDKLMSIALKTGQVLQVPADIIIKLGKSFIDIVNEEVEDLVDTFQLIDSITETKEEKEQRETFKITLNTKMFENEETTE